jgi:hypothetical protein
VEINIECPKQISNEVAQNLQKCMAEAGNYLFKDLDFPADAEINNHWVH